jgi:hypothetical protein
MNEAHGYFVFFHPQAGTIGGLQRRMFSGPATVDFNASIQKITRLTERHSLEIRVEAFNVLNRANYQLPNNTFGTGTTPRAGFGAATAAADPRQVQFGLRVDF